MRATCRGRGPAAPRAAGRHRGYASCRIDLPGGAGTESLEHVDWDEWLEEFDEQKLAAVLQERKVGGEDSTFIKLVSRDKVVAD